MKKKLETTAQIPPGAKSKPVPIVAIGASAGGLEAMTQLLQHLSPATGLAFVYIQHLDPDHASMLSSILARHTSMPVQEAEHLMPVEPNHVYIIPPNKSMESIDGILTLNSREAKPAIPMPIDQFFISLSERQKEGGIAVILSGTGNDGTIGLKAIKSVGGITIAQNETAKFQGMPQSAIQQGTVDLILPPDQIAQELERLSKQVTKMQQSILNVEDEAVLPNDSVELKNILQLLRHSSGVDFTNYKMNTIKRRIMRRMLLHKIETLPDYLSYLKNHATEAGFLYNDLLINVTSFFRDPETLDFLKKTLLPPMLHSKSANETLRIWVPGCSTGEEAFSLAIIITEILGAKVSDTSFQIFATDLSDVVISKARQGLYSATDLVNVSPQRLQRFFTKTDGKYRISKSIRDRCVFAPHNIFKDPPFPRLDLISCCNLFIYLNQTLQKKIIATFHYALLPDGHLILGKSETIGSSTRFFKQVDRKHKVYIRKNEVSNWAALEISRLSEPLPKENLPAVRKPPFKNTEAHETLENRVDQVLLRQFVPPTVVVNQEMDIFQFRGATGLFLEPASGKASLNLLKMARPELVFELRNAVHKSAKTGEAVKKLGLPMTLKHKTYLVDIDIVPLKNEGDERLYLVMFAENTNPPESGSQTTETKDKKIKQLEAELAALREDMRSITEEQEASNEELQSANEEIVASNEELQSLNEELETGKEELEATNEELLATNQELQVRNQQLSESYDFSEAVFDTIRESFLILDQDLRVKSANKTFYQTFKYTEKETEGRLIYSLGNRQWDIPKLRDLLEDIIPKNHHFYGFEVQHNFPGIGEKIMLLNAHKLIQQTTQQEMMVLAIEDVTAHRRVLQLAAFQDMANNAPVMIWVSDTQKARTFFNNTWLEFTGRSLEQELGQGWAENVHPDDLDRLMDLTKVRFEERKPMQIEFRLKRHDGVYRWMKDNSKPAYSSLGEFTGFIGSCTDVDDQKMLNQELDLHVKKRTQELVDVNLLLKRSNDELQNFAYVASHDLQEPLRKILTFSDRLQKKHKQNLDVEAREYLDVMDRAAQRMSSLIEDLLQFARITTQEKAFETVQLNEVINHCLQDFDLIIAQKKALLSIDKLPKIEAIPLQMKQLFHNLISNALKFSKKELAPEIQVTCQTPALNDTLKYVNSSNPKAYTEIIFRDHGIGFEPQFADKIFAIFQRLHGKQEYEGTGIGLALCRAVVVNHGGAIYASSEKGAGASFHIILPLKHVQPD